MIRNVKSGLLAAFAAFALAGCGERAPLDLALQRAGSLAVGIATTPDPPATGSNALTVVVRDASGSPVRGAAIEAVVFMPAMGAMPYMESRGTVTERGPGLYRVRYGLSMQGDWDVTLRVTPPGGAPSRSAWRLSTNRKGVAFVSADAPAGAGADTATAASDSGVVVLDASRRQALGIRLGTVESRVLAVPIRASGRIAWDETRRSDVTLQFGGFVRELHADFVGKPVSKGAVLFTVNSPDLLAAEHEYLDALTAQGSSLAVASRRKLERWGIGADVLDDLARTHLAREALPVTAPSSGVIVEKNVVQGSAFQPGEVLFRIAPLDPVWVVAALFPADLPLVRVGQSARLRDPYGGGAERTGRIAFVAPSVDGMTRTGEVRIEVSNRDGALRPGAFVDVELDVPLGKRVAVPEGAVLPTGERTLVFVDLGGGRLAPRDVVLGARAGDWYEVRSGLVPGEAVVTSGNFLVAAESRLRSATGKW